jgi:hypothetical protein
MSGSIKHRNNQMGMQDIELPQGIGMSTKEQTIVQPKDME